MSYGNGLMRVQDQMVFLPSVMNSKHQIKLDKLVSLSYKALSGVTNKAVDTISITLE